MQEGRREVKVEATVTTRFRITLWNKIGLDRISYYVDGLLPYTLGCYQQANHLSIHWLGHPNPNHLIKHYRSIFCLNTLLGSVRYLSTLLKYILFYYIAELYLILTHCLDIPNSNTLLRWTRTHYIAELYPTLKYCCFIPYHITLLSNSQRLIPCWAIPNPNTLLRYSLSYYIAEQFPIPIHCRATPNPNTLLRYTKH